MTQDFYDILNMRNSADLAEMAIQIEGAGVQADWDATEGKAEILNKPSLFVPYTDGGFLVEGFESADQIIPCTLNGWTRVTTDKKTGAYSLFSGRYQTGHVIFTFNMPHTGDVSFWYKIIKENDGINDYAIKIDGIVVKQAKTAPDWTQFTTSLVSGEHTLEINSNVTGGFWNEMYIDDLTIPASRIYHQDISEHSGYVAGATGTFTTADSKTVTVIDGVITTIA